MLVLMTCSYLESWPHPSYFEIEVCGDLRCWIRRSASAGARRCVAVTAGHTTGNCPKWSRDIWIGNMYVACCVAQLITRGKERVISIVLFVLKSTVNKVARSSSGYFTSSLTRHRGLIAAFDHGSVVLPKTFKKFGWLASTHRRH